MAEVFAYIIVAIIFGYILLPIFVVAFGIVYTVIGVILNLITRK